MTEGMPKGGQFTALIVHPVLPEKKSRSPEDSYLPGVEEQVEEAKGLAHAIYLDILDVRVARVAKITPGHFLGKGTREEIAAFCAEAKPSVVIVNHTLSPVQQRNLEKEWKSKVIDRTGLILEIFGARAQTREGKIQVELAALEYQKSRIVRAWTHLERQRGGGGFIGGPGEKQRELDRRHITDKILRLKKDLEQVRRKRDLERKNRERVPFPIIALVGYTNAGKSTLFNRMTGAEVFAEDLLFATLDPTMRKVKLKSGQDVIFSDTVGFIADLPTHLVAAFRATLEQVQYADVIVHVRDMSCPAHEAQKDEVVSILGDLGIDYEQDQRIIEAWNKIDALPEEERADVLRKARFEEDCIALSALTGEGTDDLLRAVQKMLGQSRHAVAYKLKVEDGEALAWLYKRAHVVKRRDHEDHFMVDVNIAPADIGRFRERFGYEPG